jgi:hypothetical protein
VRGPFDAFILLSFFAGSHVLITLVVFTRWTGLLLGYRDRALPLTRLRELARPWLLASIIWCVVFLVVMELAIRALAGSIALRGEATGPDWQTDLQIFVELNPMLVAIPAWMLASFAAAARFLQSSARVADLRAERLSMILRASPQAARAYAIAPLPAILSTYAILAIAEPIGPEWWSTFTWGAYGPLNTIVATLLIGGIGVGAIQASTTVAGD